MCESEKKIPSPQEMAFEEGYAYAIADVQVFLEEHGHPELAELVWRELMESEVEEGDD